ncbi:MAG: hypothetical protein EZS28_019631 [Streblomastix strix]|uniref:Tyr recombinase domain-containing protein n=1 Tax=Streblomastix strix TaxID=222440 RepID=A0A5J4VQE6_9EUKA|nr:MAG: hypothetical protein EZS28_019631 [Streblomastix strix]
MFRQDIKEFASSVPSDQKRLQYSSFRHQEMESINIINNENQTGSLNNRKARNLDPDYSPPRSQKRYVRRTKQTIKSRRLQTKREDFSTDMSSDELESNNRLILTTLQQPTAKIHVNNKRTRINSNRCSQSNIEDGTSMGSSSYPPPSSSSEEDQRRADRSNDNSSTVARQDKVYRTGKREYSIPSAWLEQRNSGIRNIINQEKFETSSKKDMLFPDGLKARKERRFAKKILRILNVSKGAIDNILCGQRYNIQRRNYYANGKTQEMDLNQSLHNTLFIIIETTYHYNRGTSLIHFCEHFSKLSTSVSQWTLFNTLTHIRYRFNEQPKAPIYQESDFSTHDRQTEIRRHMKRGNTIRLFERKGSNRNLTNIELLTKLTSFLMTICSMRPAEIEGISLRLPVICEKTNKVDLRLQPKTKSGLHPHKLPKTRDRIICPRATFFDWLKRIDNKQGRSIRENKYGALWWNEDITVPAKRGQISFRLKKLLDVMGIKGKQVYSF